MGSAAFPARWTGLGKRMGLRLGRTSTGGIRQVIPVSVGAQTGLRKVTAILLDFPAASIQAVAGYRLHPIQFEANESERIRSDRMFASRFCTENPSPADQLPNFARELDRLLPGPARKVDTFEIAFARAFWDGQNVAPEFGPSPPYPSPRNGERGAGVRKGLRKETGFRKVTVFGR